MAYSKAKKKRLKQIQAGRRDPESLRGSWHGIQPVTKTTPSLTERKSKLDQKYKRKWSTSSDYDGSIFFISPHRTETLVMLC